MPNVEIFGDSISEYWVGENSKVSADKIFGVFQQEVTDFFSDNKDIHLGFAFGGSSIDQTNKDFRYSDIDSNVVLQEENLPTFITRLGQSASILGTYFDSMAPYPLLHSLVNVAGRIYRWDIFLFVPGEMLPVDDPLRRLPIVVADDPQDIFKSLSFSRINYDSGVEFEDFHLHLTDWLFYLWNKTIRNIPIGSDNVLLFNEALRKWFHIEEFYLTQEDIESPENLAHFISSVGVADKFRESLPSQVEAIFNSLVIQEQSDLAEYRDKIMLIDQALLLREGQTFLQE